MIGEAAASIHIHLLDTSPDGYAAAVVEPMPARVTRAASYTELADAFGAAPRSIAIVAFEDLFPEPQAKLRTLRASSVGSRVVVIYRADDRRVRLGQRLWSIGAVDYFLEAISARSDVRVLSHQLAADVAISRTGVRAPPSGEPGAPEVFPARALQELAAALANHRDVDGLLREVWRRLPSFLDYTVLGVLTLGGRGPKLHFFQSASVHHDVIWSLAAQLCQSLTISGVAALDPGKVEFVNAAPPDLAEHASGSLETLVLPLSVLGEAIGALGIAAPRPELAQVADGAFELMSQQIAISLRHVELLDQARQVSVTDTLTGLPNRRHLDRVLAEEWQRAQRYSLQLSIVFMDLDRLKELNERHGHGSGDRVIREVASELQSVVRSTDHVVRYAGDKFVILLPETGGGSAALFCERVRAALKRSRTRIKDDVELAVSATFGLASFPDVAVASGQQLLDRADEALRAGKAAGGDSIRIFGAPEPVPATAPGWANRRRATREVHALPVTFIPIADPDLSRGMKTVTVDVSEGGLSFHDRSRTILPRSYGLAFLDQRTDPMLCRVAWTLAKGDEHLVGLEALGVKAFEHGLAAARGETPANRIAVVVMENPTHRAIVSRILHTSRCEVRPIAADGSDFTEQALEGAFLVVISGRALQGPLGERLLAARASHSLGLRMLVLSDEQLDRTAAIALISQQQVEHLISPEGNVEDALFSSLSKMISADYFGVRRYLLPGVEVRRWAVSAPPEKEHVLNGIRQMALDIDCHDRMADLLIAATDEMLINAVYHAPQDGVSLAAKPIAVECAADGRFLAVGVTDQHGRLDVADIFRGLALGVAHGSQPMAEDAKSASIGFRIMLASLSQVVVNVEPGRRTEVIGLLDLRKTLREHRGSAPSLGVFHDK